MNVDKDYYQKWVKILFRLFVSSKESKEKIINNLQYILNIIIRFLVILTFFLSKIYKIFLRN